LAWEFGAQQKSIEADSWFLDSGTRMREVDTTANAFYQIRVLYCFILESH